MLIQKKKEQIICGTGLKGKKKMNFMNIERDKRKKIKGKSITVTNQQKNKNIQQ